MTLKTILIWIGIIQVISAFFFLIIINTVKEAYEFIKIKSSQRDPLITGYFCNECGRICNPYKNGYYCSYLFCSTFNTKTFNVSTKTIKYRPHVEGVWIRWLNIN